MPSMTIAGMRVGGLAAAILVAAMAPAAAQELNEKTVKRLMDYAWQLTPQKFTPPDGKSIEIDKKNRGAIEVPVDVAREVIKVGRLTAHAQMCELPEDQVLNFRSLMQRERDKKKWSDQQIIYINQLHLITVAVLTGKDPDPEQQQDGGKQATAAGRKPGAVQTCSDEERKKVKGLITDYVKSGPPVSIADLTSPAPAGAAPPPPAAATPTAAPAAKKK